MERTPSPHEKVQRTHPSNEDIMETFSKIVGGRPVSGERPVLDANGEIKILTVTVTNPDASKEEFQYVRSESIDDIPVILATTIGADGSLGSAHLFAEYKSGAWVVVESGI